MAGDPRSPERRGCSGAAPSPQPPASTGAGGAAPALPGPRVPATRGWQRTPRAGTSAAPEDTATGPAPSHVAAAPAARPAAASPCAAPQLPAAEGEEEEDGEQRDVTSPAAGTCPAAAHERASAAPRPLPFLFRVRPPSRVSPAANWEAGPVSRGGGGARGGAGGARAASTAAGAAPGARDGGGRRRRETAPPPLAGRLPPATGGERCPGGLRGTHAPAQPPLPRRRGPGAAAPAGREESG